MIMRAIILAGGYAKRMGQVAAELPKSLLPIAGRPAIDYILDKLTEIAPEKILLTTNIQVQASIRVMTNLQAPDKYRARD